MIFGKKMCIVNLIVFDFFCAILSAKQFSDTAGAERYRQITLSYYSTARYVKNTFFDLFKLIWSVDF